MKRSICLFWLWLSVFLALSISVAFVLLGTAVADENERFLFYDPPEGPIPLYDVPDNIIIGYCHNSLSVTLLAYTSDGWSCILMGDVKGYVQSKYLLERDARKGRHALYTAVRANSEDIDHGASVYSGTGERIGYIPNGEIARVFFENDANLCYLSFYLHGEEAYGYASKDQLISTKTSDAFYPRDSNVILDGSTYVFHDQFPKDMQKAFSHDGWENAKCIVGGILARDSSIAFAAVQNGQKYYLCYLERKNDIWSLEAAFHKALYQDGTLPISITLTTPYPTEMTVYYPSTKGHLECYSFTQPAADAPISEWNLNTGFYLAPDQSLRAGVHLTNEGVLAFSQSNGSYYDPDPKTRLVMPTEEHLLINFNIERLYSEIVE